MDTWLVRARTCPGANLSGREPVWREPVWREPERREPVWREPERREHDRCGHGQREPDQREPILRGDPVHRGPDRCHLVEHDLPRRLNH
jgi:hypothetical protein